MAGVFYLLLVIGLCFLSSTSREFPAPGKPSRYLLRSRPLFVLIMVLAPQSLSVTITVLATYLPAGPDWLKLVWALMTIVPVGLGISLAGILSAIVDMPEYARFVFVAFSAMACFMANGAVFIELTG